MLFCCFNFSPNAEFLHHKSLPYMDDTSQLTLDCKDEIAYPKVRVLHKFRREKSFDLSLLLNRNQNEQQFAVDADVIAEQPLHPTNKTKKSTMESRLHMRKMSQPPSTNIPPQSVVQKIDFQQELMEIARCRFENKSLSDKDDNIEATSDFVRHPSFRRPIPRVRYIVKSTDEVDLVNNMNTSSTGTLAVDDENNLQINSVDAKCDVTGQHMDSTISDVMLYPR